jgi:sugar/nucleoside kinase (ribokinase family)
VILLVEGQDRRYIHVFGANEVFTCTHIDRDWLRKLKAFYLGGLFGMSGIDLEELGDVLQTCQDNNVITFVDILAPESLQGFDSIKDLLPRIDYFLPNDDEAAHITGKTDPVDQIRAFKEHGANDPLCEVETDKVTMEVESFTGGTVLKICSITLNLPFILITCLRGGNDIPYLMVQRFL